MFSYYAYNSFFFYSRNLFKHQSAFDEIIITKREKASIFIQKRFVIYSACCNIINTTIFEGYCYNVLFFFFILHVFDKKKWAYRLELIIGYGIFLLFVLIFKEEIFLCFFTFALDIPMALYLRKWNCATN